MSMGVHTLWIKDEFKYHEMKTKYNLPEVFAGQYLLDIIVVED